MGLKVDFGWRSAYSSHEKRLQQTVCACEGSGLGPEGEDEPDPGLDEETGTIVERGLTMKDLQTLVDKRVVRPKTHLQRRTTSQKR